LKEETKKRKKKRKRRCRERGAQGREGDQEDACIIIYRKEELDDERKGQRERE
jgi:hypothetical protein